MFCCKILMIPKSTTAPTAPARRVDLDLATLPRTPVPRHPLRRPPLTMILLLLLLAGDVSAVLDTSTPRPPRGVNTFDSYGDLNHSVVLSLGRAMRDQLLRSHSPCGVSSAPVSFSLSLSLVYYVAILGCHSPAGRDSEPSKPARQNSRRVPRSSPPGIAQGFRA